MLITSALRTRFASAGTIVAMVAAGLFVTAALAAPAASADTPVFAPGVPGPILQGTASTVTADALPTVQVDGVVWSQAVVGNTVFAGGKFTVARPAGSAAGQNTTSRPIFLHTTSQRGPETPPSPRV